MPVYRLSAVGGNHEASNYMWELYHGGWAAPNIRYLGAAGCIKFGGLRIAGLSGIYKQVGASMSTFTMNTHAHCCSARCACSA